MKTKLSKALPRKHSDFELKNKIDYYKWVISLSIIGLSASAALYHYFDVNTSWPVYFIGWFCLTACIWIGFQTVYAMAATRLYQIPNSIKKKIDNEFEKVTKKGSHSKTVFYLLSNMETFFKGIAIGSDITDYLFMIGFFSLAIAVFVPIGILNPLKAIVVIPPCLFVIWLVTPKVKK